MSYVALATSKYDEMVHFYGTLLGFPTVERWDRHNARGCRFDIGGMRLEIFDNEKERRPLELLPAGERFHIVIEVDDVLARHGALGVDAPKPQETSWGATLFQVQDPDGLPVTFLQWAEGVANS